MIPQLALELNLVVLVGRLRLELHLLNLRAGALDQSGRAARGGERARTISSASSSSRLSRLRRFLRSSARRAGSALRVWAGGRRVRVAGRRTTSQRVSLAADLVADALEDGDEVGFVLDKDGRVHGERPRLSRRRGGRGGAVVERGGARRARGRVRERRGRSGGVCACVKPTRVAASRSRC